MVKIGSYCCKGCNFYWSNVIGSEKNCECPKCQKVVSPFETEKHEDDYVFYEGSCCDGWSTKAKDVDGFCHDCGGLTSDGYAISGCNYSPYNCETCGSRPCDQSC